MDTKRSIVWRYYIDCRKTDNNTVECKSCMKKYGYKGNTTNMFQHIKTYHPHLYNEIVIEQHRISALQTSNLLPNTGEEDRIKKHHHAPIASSEYADIDVKPETINDSYCDQSFIAESPARCDDSLQEPSTSVSTATCASNASTSHYDSSAPKRKRTYEIDISRMISSISADIRGLIDQSVKTSDGHFCQSVAFELEKMDEDCKDLVKAAIWQVIYKVKSAKKRNLEVMLDDMFK